MLSGAVATYASGLPGVDARYEVQPTGVKDTLTLAGPSSASTFTYRVSLPAGASLHPAAGGALTVLDAGGSPALTVAAPTVADSAPGATTPRRRRP